MKMSNSGILFKGMKENWIVSAKVMKVLTQTGQESLVV
jgi:hypothetical protein